MTFAVELATSSVNPVERHFMSELKLEEFLTEQSKHIFQATIEPVEDQPKKCRLTPWVEHGGCQCSSALIIEKSQIKSVTKTEHRHFCCGKSLTVVEVNFAENASIPLSDVFAQASQSAKSGHHEHIPHHTDMPTQAMHVHQGTPYQLPQGAFAGVHSAIGSASGYEGFVDNSAPFIQCPPGQIPSSCGGTLHCIHPGQVCCGSGPCPVGYQCMTCGGQLRCYPNGSTCCMSGACGPGYHCAVCGTTHTCIPNGSHC